MKLRDFESRFEETLKLNKLQYTVEVCVEPRTQFDDSWTWKKFSVMARCPKFDNPLLVTLGKYSRSAKPYRRAKTSCTCFVVPATLMFQKSKKVRHGLRAVWQEIRLHCMPL